MKIRWVLTGMDGLLTEHLIANLEYWRLDIILSSRQVMKRIKRSERRGSMKLFKHLANIKAVLEAMDYRDQNISNIIDTKVSKHDGSVFVDISVDNQYFVYWDNVSSQYGRMGRQMMKVKAMGRQEIVDNFEREFSKVYTKDFYGEVLEDDGAGLRVREKK